MDEKDLEFLKKLATLKENGIIDDGELQRRKSEYFEAKEEEIRQKQIKEERERQIIEEKRKQEEKRKKEEEQLRKLKKERRKQFFLRNRKYIRILACIGSVVLVAGIALFLSLGGGSGHMHDTTFQQLYYQLKTSYERDAPEDCTVYMSYDKENDEILLNYTYNYLSLDTSVSNWDDVRKFGNELSKSIREKFTEYGYDVDVTFRIFGNKDNEVLLYETKNGVKVYDYMD